MHSKNGVELGDILPYVTRLLDKGISQYDIDYIMKKIGIEYKA